MQRGISGYQKRHLTISYNLGQLTPTYLIRRSYSSSVRAEVSPAKRLALTQIFGYWELTCTEIHNSHHLIVS